jgi:hypothetical protein
MFTFKWLNYLICTHCPSPAPSYKYAKLHRETLYKTFKFYVVLATFFQISSLIIQFEKGMAFDGIQVVLCNLDMGCFFFFFGGIGVWIRGYRLLMGVKEDEHIRDKLSGEKYFNLRIILETLTWSLTVQIILCFLKTCSKSRCSCPQKKRHIDLRRPHRQDLCGRCKDKKFSCGNIYNFKYIIWQSLWLMNS